MTPVKSCNHKLSENTFVTWEITAIDTHLRVYFWPDLRVYRSDNESDEW